MKRPALALLAAAILPSIVRADSPAAPTTPPLKLYARGTIDAKCDNKKYVIDPAGEIKIALYTNQSGEGYFSGFRGYLKKDKTATSLTWYFGQGSLTTKTLPTLSDLKQGTLTADMTPAAEQLKDHPFLGTKNLEGPANTITTEPWDVRPDETFIDENKTALPADLSCQKDGKITYTGVQTLTTVTPPQPPAPQPPAPQPPAPQPPAPHPTAPKVTYHYAPLYKISYKTKAGPGLLVETSKNHWKSIVGKHVEYPIEQSRGNGIVTLYTGRGAKKTFVDVHVGGGPNPVIYAHNVKNKPLGTASITSIQGPNPTWPGAPTSKKQEKKRREGTR